MVGFAPIRLLLIVFVVVGVIFLFTALLQWLWNITMPDVFGLKVITFWQAFRLLLIATMLFGGGGIISS